MPHRTVFQLGKNHAHPFTMFIGGFVLGVIVTGSVAWAWAIADNSDFDANSVLTARKKASPKTTASPSASIRPSASPAVSF